MSCSLRTWLGAYVLDALEPDEATVVQRHIASCAACQDEVVSLSWIPALLRTVTLEEVERLHAGKLEDGPRTPVLERVLVAARTGERTSRLRRPISALLAIVAAATLAGSVADGSGVSAGDAALLAGGAHAMTVRTVDPRSHVSAAVLLTARNWGTGVRLWLSGVRPGEQCSLVARARNGRVGVAATWAASYRGAANVSGTTAIPVNQLRELDIVTAGGVQLARLVLPDGK